MRPALASLLLLAGCPGCAGNQMPGPQLTAETTRPAPSAAAGPPQIWRGMLRCAPVSGLSTMPLSQPVELTVSGNTASYDRAVGRADTSVATEVREHGDGTVAPDGSLTLAGQATARAYHYTSQYSGMLQPNGEPSRLLGKQLWSSQRANPIDRSCSMTLRRDG